MIPRPEPRSGIPKRHARREAWRHRTAALLLVAPLLIFLGFTFLAPIGSMLFRSVHNPEAAQLIPRTLDAMGSWEGSGLPPASVRTVFATELRSLFGERRSGRLGAEVNRVMPGASSAIQTAGRRLSGMPTTQVEANGAALLSGIHSAWGEPQIWQALNEAGRTFTDRNFLTALDLERAADGGVQARASARIYIDLYVKTLRMALIIMIATLALGYPLAFFLAHLRTRRANVLLVFVLLPFLTSLLVRTTAWITLLQTHGMVNSTLLWLGAIDEPVTWLYTEFATVLAMTHILLPFMVLPLYAVMRGIDPSHMRAALSLGARPLRAWWTVYLPASLPGLMAGAMLVFIISVGYYITPALVGGTDGQMISNLIAFHMTQSNNWGLAAALGSLLLALILVLYFIFDRLAGAGRFTPG